MHYRVIRDDQEYGPYTIEEISQYVQEGSILPNDYVHNGMDWQPVSQFLQNPHKAAASMHSISSVANAKPDWSSTNSKNSSIGFWNDHIGMMFGGFIKWGVLSVIVFFGVYYFSTFIMKNTYVTVKSPASSKFSLSSGDVLLYEGSPYTGTKSEFYPDGQKRAEMYYKNGRRFGISNAWHENGQKWVRADFKNGLPEGRLIIWYESGLVKKVDAYFEEGIPDGEFNYWYDNDQLFFDAVYNNGFPERMKGWRENGDPWFHFDLNEDSEIAKVWNKKGELIDPEGLESDLEKQKFGKMLEEFIPDNIWVLSL